MIKDTNPGLGELLRHLTELLDRGSQEDYAAAGLHFRPRYTPVMRALDANGASVTDLQDRLRVTQGAISQTVKLMEEDGLVTRSKTHDNRSRIIHLSPKGQAMRQHLFAQWERRFLAIQDLEDELNTPLRCILERTLQALEKEGFAARIARLAKNTGT